MSQIRIGTCSWKYDSWKGIVYPNEKNINYLEEYSRHYDTVEIDQWFWSLHKIDDITLPDPEVVKVYTDSVPDDFLFSIKVPNSLTLTHLYKKAKTDPLIPNPHFLSKELFDQFLESISGFGNKTGPLIFQFEYLNKEKMNSCAEFIDKFEAFICDADRQFNIAVEIRNPNFLTEGFFNFLNENSLFPVLLQGYFMPSIFNLFKRFKNTFEQTVIVRLHGPDREGIEERSNKKWNQILAPKDEELEQLRMLIGYFQSKSLDLFVNVNNHYEGSAPLTIKKIKELLSP